MGNGDRRMKDKTIIMTDPQPELKVDVFIVMMGATKRDGNNLLYSASKSETVIENKYRAMTLYSEMVKQIEQLRSEGWTSGRVIVFRPKVNRNGTLNKVPTGDYICERVFGDQVDVNNIVSIEDW